ncbi:RNA polymerase sigma factor [Bariatricus sp. SGI.154]|uniref:RNA polymerase sigma factor n=1 Tax=Bariatricus sp. SGI.154 TaxID=3420549 RepID=UPI003CFFF34F
MTREKELLKQIKKGDASGFEELVSMYYSDIFRFCIYHCPDKETAKDAVQETFLKVFRYFPRYQNQGRFRAFLYIVAANTCADMWRKRKDVLPEEEMEDLEYQEMGYARTESEVIWTPYLMVAAELVEVPVFLWLTVRAYCKREAI